MYFRADAPDREADRHARDPRALWPFWGSAGSSAWSLSICNGCTRRDQNRSRFNGLCPARVLTAAVLQERSSFSRHSICCRASISCAGYWREHMARAMYRRH